MGILVYKHKKKLQLEEKAIGITTVEPTELENLPDTITALEESGEAELQEKKGASNRKLQYDLAKAVVFCRELHVETATSCVLDNTFHATCMS